MPLQTKKCILQKTKKVLKTKQAKNGAFLFTLHLNVNKECQIKSSNSSTV